jgi:hypothetical protein
MEPLTADDIRACLVNCSKGEAKRLAVPRDLAERPWDNLDFLGWRDPSGSDRGALVAEHDGKLLGVVLRVVSAPTVLSGGGRFAGGRFAGARASMCSLCLTTHPGGGVTLMAAARRKNRDNTVGIRICVDFACSLYARGLKDPPVGGMRVPESLTVEEKAGRIRENLSAFLEKV